jgi:hypothetical protein
LIGGEFIYRRFGVQELVNPTSARITGNLLQAANERRETD